MISDDLLEYLREAVGTANLWTADALVGVDPGWNPDNLNAGVVVTPSTTHEVPAVLQICDLHGIGVVPQGGRTRLVGGAVSCAGQMVLSTAKLNRIVDLDPVARVAIVEAGVTPGHRIQVNASDPRIEAR